MRAFACLAARFWPGRTDAPRTARRINPDIKNENYAAYNHPVYFDSVCAYSEHIFTPMSKQHLLKVFEFSDEVKNTEAYKFWSERNGTYNIAHLRRDDISNAEYNKNNQH